MRIQRERVRNCVRQMEAIIREYYAKTAAPIGVPEVSMAWSDMIMLEEQDKFVLITVRDDKTNEMQGFVTYYIGPNPSFNTTLFATCGTLAVRLEDRGKGIATALLKAAEPLLKMHDVKRITHGFRTVYDSKPLFPKLGYELTEMVYVKVL